MDFTIEVGTCDEFEAKKRKCLADANTLSVLKSSSRVQKRSLRKKDRKVPGTTELALSSDG